jgi:hypothetical protein
MAKISLMRLLSKLAILAGIATPAIAATDRVVPDPLLVSDAFIDREHVEERDAAALLGRNLAIALQRMEPIEATHIASGWAMSPDPMRRIGVARALEWQFPLIGDAVVIDHLSRDPDPAIRASCARAAWIRRATGGDPGVLDRLSRDIDPDVRASASWPR